MMPRILFVLLCISVPVLASAQLVKVHEGYNDQQFWFHPESRVFTEGHAAEYKSSRNLYDAIDPLLWGNGSGDQEKADFFDFYSVDPSSWEKSGKYKIKLKSVHMLFDNCLEGGESNSCFNFGEISFSESNPGYFIDFAAAASGGYGETVFSFVDPAFLIDFMDQNFLQDEMGFHYTELSGDTVIGEWQRPWVEVSFRYELFRDAAYSIPEPAAYTLMLIGLFAMNLSSRWKRNSGKGELTIK